MTTTMRPLLLFFVTASCFTNLSFALSVVDRQQLARSRLQEALSSPSRKLTLSPELLIPDPTDPTAILLQTSAIQTLSINLRNAKTNAGFLKGSVSSVQTFLAEQETARGNFPGPLPVVYCTKDSEECTDDDLQELSEAGATGVLVTMPMGTFGEHVDLCKRALESGLQPIPEVVLDEETTKSWTTKDVESLVDTLSTTLEMEPASILLTIDSDDEDQQQVTIPPVPREVTKKIPILGSVSVPAGKNRIGAETERFKEAGFTGCVLRAACVPVGQSADVEAIGRFWEACISDLKSTRSKSFSFRAKNRMEKNEVVNWLNYSQDVVDSGALGESDFEDGGDLNAEAGDYKGF